MSEATILAALNALQEGLLAVATEAGVANEFVAGWKNNPILGGNLNVNDKEIVSAEGGSIVLRPDNQSVVHSLRAPGAVRRVIGSTYTITENDDGLTLYTDSSSASAVAMLSGLPTDTHFALWQDGDGIITLTAGSGETIAGEATWASQGKGRMAYLCKTSATNWSVAA